MFDQFARHASSTETNKDGPKGILFFSPLLFRTKENGEEDDDRAARDHSGTAVHKNAWTIRCE
jgi:hypothetical protein